jgi:hypothetical protein
LCSGGGSLLRHLAISFPKVALESLRCVQRARLIRARRVASIRRLCHSRTSRGSTARQHPRLASSLGLGLSAFKCLTHYPALSTQPDPSGSLFIPSQRCGEAQRKCLVEDRLRSTILWEGSFISRFRLDIGGVRLDMVELEL